MIEPPLLLWLQWGAVTIGLLAFCWLVSLLLDEIDERRRRR